MYTARSYLTFIPWIFDDKEAWEKSVQDPRYNYELPLDHFMAIYQEYRTTVPEDQKPSYSFAISTAPVLSSLPTQVTTPMQTIAETEWKPEAPDGILSQNEIDALLAGL